MGDPWSDSMGGGPDMIYASYDGDNLAYTSEGGIFGDNEGYYDGVF